MRIQLLRLREKFNDNFLRSLKDFMVDKYQWQGDVYWCKGFLFFNKPNQIKFYVNDFLNVIYPSSMPRKQLDAYTKEFRYNSNVFRFFAQRCYVFLAVRFPLEMFTTSYTLVIIDAPENMKNWVFLPGNHSHRIIDMDACSSTVFIKDGFMRSFIKADATSRIKYDFMPSPKVLDFSSSYGWYVEELVTGLPINRLSNQEDRKFALDKSNKAMLELYSSTLKMVEIDDYVEQLENRIESVIEAISVFVTDKDKVDLLTFLKKVSIIIGQCKSDAIFDIPLVISHGDYQSANVLLDGDKVWIIDWEYSQLRSLYYDVFCMKLNSRFSPGLSQRIEILLDELEVTSLFDSLPYPLSAGNELFFWVFIMEDLLLRLSEVSTTEIRDKMSTLLPWINEILSVNSLNKY